jgi:beta-glucosidase
LIIICFLPFPVQPELTIESNTTNITTTALLKITSVVLDITLITPPKLYNHPQVQSTTKFGERCFRCGISVLLVEFTPEEAILLTKTKDQLKRVRVEKLLACGNAHGSVETRIKDLVSMMTLEEKVAQLGSVGGSATGIKELCEGEEFSPQKAKRFLKNGIGQITRIAGGFRNLEPRKAARLANKIQRFLKDKTRLRIPAMVHEECLSGFMANGATTFPQAIGLASTWRPEMIEKVSSVIRKQMMATGAHQGLAPVADVARDPRWGRVEETFGEDPYLVAQMAVAYVRGLQSRDYKSGIIATLKHFAAHGFSEGGRNIASVHVSERELREVSLFPFEAGVRAAGAGSVMNAYHEIDGIPCACSRKLLTEILRGEWGFQGIVVADYGSVDLLTTLHKVAPTKKVAAKLALEAGIDVELPGSDCYGEPLIQAVRERLVSESTIDEGVIRVLRMKFLMGLFERRYVNEKNAGKVFDTVSDRRLALQAACESTILLKNDGSILPLSKRIKSIAVIGPNAASTRNLLGDYTYTAHLSCGTDAVRIVNILEGIRNKVSSRTRVLYAEGCDLCGNSRDGFDAAVEVAKNAEVSVMVVGGKSGITATDTCGEGRDRSDLRLPGVQENLVKAIHQTGKPVIVIIIDGRPLSISWIAQHIPAIIHAWLPGEEGGNAIADVLFGDFNPGGRLPISVPKAAGQIPVYYNRKPSSFGDYVSMDSKPLFPFGHGLSYTEFKYSNLKINPAKVPPAGKIVISVDIMNTGSRRGDEVIQLYLRDAVASVSRPVKELKGFKRVTLRPNEKKTLTFTLSTDQLAFYDKDMRFVVEPGVFEVMIGSSSDDIRLTAEFDVEGTEKEVLGYRTFFTETKVP